jgi:glycerol uptake facilitator protein
MPTSALGEFIGTALLILLGNGVVANVVLSETKGHGSGWIVITTGWALAVLSGVLVALSLGAPGELNPAVSVANVIFGTRTMPDAVWHIGAQFAGALGVERVVVGRELSTKEIAKVGTVAAGQEGTSPP